MHVRGEGWECNGDHHSDMKASFEQVRGEGCGTTDDAPEERGVGSIMETTTVI